MALCLGVYPKPVARLIRWMVNRNPKRTVMLSFKGRSPKKGFKYGMGGELKLERARRVAVYVRWNPHTPVNKAHEKAARKAKIIAAQYEAQRIADMLKKANALVAPKGE